MACLDLPSSKRHGFAQQFKRQLQKMVKHTQTIRWEFADELLVCLIVLWG